MPKSYAPEFRRRVIELCWAGSRPSEIAESLVSLKRLCIAGSLRRKSTLENGRVFAAASILSCRGLGARIKELEGELQLTRKASALFEEQEERRVVRPKGSTRCSWTC
jgi:hypothetical protein